MDKKVILRILLLSALLFDVSSCKDDDDDANPGTDSEDAACLIQTEANNMVGNEATYQYEYNEQGSPIKITRRNAFNQVVRSLTISFPEMIKQNPDATIRTVYEGNISENRPTQALVSITMGGVEQPNYWRYLFHYDNKNRLITVEEHTDYVATDTEWNLVISYDNKDNVSELRYVRTTEPTGVSTIIAPKGYDDHPTPYAGVKNWAFLLHDFAWDNYDPDPLLTALSKNNPLGFTMGSEPDIFDRTTTYTYNEQGFPSEKTNVTKTSQRNYTFTQSFTYDCQ